MLSGSSGIPGLQEPPGLGEEAFCAPGERFHGGGSD